MLDPGTDVLFSVSGPILGKKNPAAVNICIVYRYIVTIYRYKIFSWDIINCYRILLQNILRDIVVWYRCVIYILLVDIVWGILMKYWLLKDIVLRYRYKLSASVCRLSGSATRRLQSLRLAEEAELYQQSWQIPL